MPQVSKNPVDKKTKEQIIEYLYDLVAKLVNKEHVSSVLDKLLTKTEKIMLAKRIAILILLNQGWSIIHISRVLKMSTSTVIKFKNEWENGNTGFLEIVRIFEKDKKTNKIVEHLASILSEIIDFVPAQKNYARPYRR